MSVTVIPPVVKMTLCGKAAGRCQYEGCNKQLNIDKVTKSKLNTSYFAHIYGDQSLGPRYDAVLSPQLAKDISNLMLLCDEHHRLIDREGLAEHSAARLIQMKQLHEERIERVTAITPQKQSHIILFGANIGTHGATLNYSDASNAMLPLRYPSDSKAIELGVKNSPFEDDTTEFWQLQKAQLQQMFNQQVRPLIHLHDVQHFSVFALAPIPLLICLGGLLSDISETDIYQRHREPASWKWQEDVEVNEFFIKEPTNTAGVPVLKLSLSASITDDRITNVIGSDCS
ncbi:MAG: SAVED domain-containing protein, partial [Sphingobacteriaceae bacterium]